MRKPVILIIVCFLTLGCTSKTIYPKPKDLIPKDSMGLLLKDLFIANAAKNIQNIRLQKRINYHPLVYEKFKIDSTRFESSNFYYISRIDDYEQILENVILSIEREQKTLVRLKQVKDSIYKDSLKKLQKNFSSKKIQNLKVKEVKE